jgi:hypothetical protein
MSAPSTTVSDRELVLLRAALASLGLDEVQGEAFHLDVDELGRHWIVQNDTGQMVIDRHDPDSVDGLEGNFAIPERIRRFGECFSADGLTLSVVDSTTVVAQIGTGIGSVSVAVDLVAGDRQPTEPWQVLPTSTAVVPAREFMLMLTAIRSMPTGLEPAEYPVPPMWLQIERGTVGLHVDWSDFVPSRGTYRLAASSTEGSATVAIPHGAIEALLRQLPWFGDDSEDDSQGDSDLTIEIGAVRHRGDVGDAISVAGDDWRVVFWTLHPLEHRWGAPINQILTEAGMTVVDRDQGEWIVSSRSIDVRVVLHHGHPDIARVSALLIDGADDNIDLLRELNQLNAASTGVRLWLEHGAADVRCNDLSPLPAVIRQVGTTAHQLAPVLAALATSGE